MAKGYCHVYTGNGKGKTTAAFGLAIRAAMAGKNVYIGQFVKGMQYSETKITTFVNNIEIEQYGDTCFIDRDPSEHDLELAKTGLNKISAILKSGQYNMVIMDEIFIAIYYNLISETAVLEILENRAEHVEVVLTGRYCPEGIINYADLVTEMREVKHYYSRGVLSRDGIDC